MSTTTSSIEAHEVVSLTADDLPVSCPRPGTPVHLLHPRVYLDVTHTGSARCPYCGAEYRLTGPAPSHH